jgi:nucleotide-binding universal stress UspA family protein
VLKRVTVPVLLARPASVAGRQSPVASTEQSALSKVLVPIDMEHPAEAALSVAGEVARACGAELYLVSVVPTVETITGDLRAAAQLTPISTAEALDVEEEQAKDYLEQMIEQLSAVGVRGTGVVQRGDTVTALTGAILDAQADLIVIATHARSGLDALWTGSVTAALAGKIARPLLMVRL